MNLSTPVERIPKIGSFHQKNLKKLGITTVQDLLFHFPHRYEDFSNIIPVSKVKVNEVCTIQGRITEIETSRTWKKKMVVTQALVQDSKGTIKAVWFNQPYLVKSLKKEDELLLSGKVVFKRGEVYLSNPIFEKTRLKKGTHTGRIVPVYRETRGISSRWIRSILKPLLFEFQNKIEEYLPREIMEENNLLPIDKALWQIHFPDSEEAIEKAKHRFSFEEIFLIELFVNRERLKMEKEDSVPVPVSLDIVKKLVNSLPFKLTDPQKKSAWQILKDMEKKRPMNRLLEGDVGSGKTIVAAIAALNAVKNGYQAAIMTPTEILAKQHFKEISDTLQDFRVNIGILTGKQDQWRSKKLKNQVVEISREKLIEKTKGKISPETNNLIPGIDILIGTHALIQDQVKFGRLALVVLDEQHRFGVKQRAKLCAKKGPVPHLLSMTATPIPRTLALTLYGDLDLSIIDSLPTGRKKITTEIAEDKDKIYEFIRKEVKKGRQAFIICPRIEENEEIEMKSVKKEYENLSEEVFPDLKMAMLHGKMSSKDKEKAMQDFKDKKTDILVSTSVVEVGIDVPNAAVMLIEGADRFGLAQLHQFRGRVGRGKYQSYCFLSTESRSQKTRRRLRALVSSEDGFALSEKDLKIRGPGDFTGVRQWGIPDLMMDSLKDISLVEKTREKAKEILEKDPDLKNYPLLRKKLELFGKTIHLE